MLGFHWLAEAAGCNPGRLADPSVHTDVLLDLAKRLGLTVQGAPHVDERPDGSVASIVLLSESHASLHANPDQGTAWLDVFSCGPEIDGDAAADLVREALSPVRLGWRIVTRGPGHDPRVQVTHHIRATYRGARVDEQVEDAARAVLPQATDRVHRFEPHGVSWAATTPRAMLVIHTWPEHGLATVDYRGTPLDLDAALRGIGWVPAARALPTPLPEAL